MNGPTGDARPPGLLRFVTLNLWGENGPHERRLDLIAAELECLAPDVVALQEVREVPGRVPNQAELLARRLGHHHVFAPATEWGGGDEGLAVLSRFPVRRSAHRALPHATETEGRIVLSVERMEELAIGNNGYAATALLPPPLIPRPG